MGIKKRPNGAREVLCECGCGQPTPLAKKTVTRRGVRKGDPLRFVPGHQNSIVVKHANAARLSRLPAEYLPEDRGYLTPCWVWQRYIDPEGYGRRKPRGVGESQMAHRFVYERTHGPVADGLVLDHLCRVRSCVNPDHLEPVTLRENILRGEGMGARYARRREGR